MSTSALDIPTSQEPLYAWVQLTNRCNLRCSYCYTESGPTAGGELSMDEAQRLLADVRAAGATTVMLSGGEPSAYPGIVDLVNFACAELGLRVTLVTNGTHVFPELLECLRRSQCTVQVSLDAVDELGYKQARGSPLLPQALRGIEALSKVGVPVTLSAALTTVNQSWVGRIVQFAIDHGIQFVHFAPTHWKDGGPFRQSLFIENLYPTLRELYELQKRNYLFVCIDLVEQLVIPVALGIQRKFYCNAMAGRTVEVSSDGSVYACAAQRSIPEMQLGRVSADQSLLQIIRDGRAAGRFPSLGAETIEECMTCEYRYICAGGCRAMTYHQSGALSLRHPNCADLKRLIGDIKNDLQTGELAEYVEFLRSRAPQDGNPDGLLKVF